MAPKILDLIYRVIDEATSRLAAIRRAQDNAAKSATGLRGALKSLKSQYTELKSALSLVKVGFDFIVGSLQKAQAAYRSFADQQIAAAQASGTMTDALRLQAAELKVYDQLQQDNASTTRELGETVNRLILLQMAQIEIWKREGRIRRTSIEELQEEIAARMKLALAMEEETAKVDGLGQALIDLQPYLKNEVTINTRQLTEAEAAAKRLVAYLKEIQNRKWGITIQGTYVGPFQPAPGDFGTIPTTGGGGTTTPGTIVFNGQTFNQAEWRGNELWVRGQKFGTR